MATNILLGIVRKAGWISLSCATAPENFTGLIRKTRPDCLVLVDAAAMGLSPGEFRIIPRHKIADVSIGTHQLPLSLLIDFLSDAAGRIVLICIQTDRIVSGEEISPRVREGAERLVHVLSSGELGRIPVLE